MKSLINISDLTLKDFNKILEFAFELKKKNEKCLINKNIGLIFEKHSTRTRLSFQVGINQLGGNFIDIRFEELNLNRFETFEDTFQMMNCYLDALVFRTTSHEKLLKAIKYFRKPIINALSDISHPCQAISDLLTLHEKFNRLDNLNIVWMGDMNNVLFSFAEACSFLDNVHIYVFTHTRVLIEKKDIFKKFNNFFIKTEIDEKIINKCDCIMTDVFLSMNDKNDNKEDLLIKFQVNNEVMSKTNDKTVFMHCLPAKIGSEVTEEVIKGPKSIVIQQAENRLYGQKGILKWLEL